MTTLEQLFDYEKVEDAWIAIRGKSDICYPEFSDVNKDASEAPYLEIQLRDVVPFGGEYPFKGEILPHDWKGTIITRHVTIRGINSDQQRALTGRTRLAIMRYQSLFTKALLPDHIVLGMRETALSRGVDDILDWSEIQAEIIFRIREDAWPK